MASFLFLEFIVYINIHFMTVRDSTTVNVDIFACKIVCGFMKVINFAWIKSCVSSTNDSLGYTDSNFHSVYIFADILGTRIKRKYIQRENFYVYSIYFCKQH